MRDERNKNKTKELLHGPWEVSPRACLYAGKRVEPAQLAGLARVVAKGLKGLVNLLYEFPRPAVAFPPKTTRDCLRFGTRRARKIRHVFFALDKTIVSEKTTSRHELFPVFQVR